MNEDFKKLLIECLNESIRLEEASYGGGSGGGRGSGLNPRGKKNDGTDSSGYEVTEVGADGYPSEREEARERKKLADIPFGTMSPGDIAASSAMYGGSKILDMLGVGGKWSSKLGRYIKGDTKGLRANLGKFAGSFVANAFGDLKKLSGQDWVDSQVQNFATNQEALRREGLGQTTGWAKIYLKPKSVPKFSLRDEDE